MEIRGEEAELYLLSFAHDGAVLTDTWHATLAEAKAQATFEYAIEDADWQEMEAP